MARHKLKWTPWLKATLSPEHVTLIRGLGNRVPDEVVQNNLYAVWITRGIKPEGFPELIWLSIKRLDKGGIHDWRHLQRIKTELLGPEIEAVELYPAESRHVDAANQYHLWALADPTMVFPFGFRNRLVVARDMDTGDAAVNAAIMNARQRPFDATHMPSDDQQ